MRPLSLTGTPWIEPYPPRCSPGSVGQKTWHEAPYPLSFAVVRLARLSGWEYHAGMLPPFARAWLWVTGIGIPVVVAKVLRRASAEMQVAATGCAAILFAPICWVTYLPICLTPAAVYLRDRLD